MQPDVFSIVISEKGGAERRQFFDQSGVSVGRVQGNDLVLPKGNVSKRHCRVEVVEGQFYVTDQGSTNGTYLNRRRIAQSTAVRQGDRIYVGDFVLRIEEGAGEGAEAHPSSRPSEPSLSSAAAMSPPRPTSLRPGAPTLSSPPPKHSPSHPPAAPGAPGPQTTATPQVPYPSRASAQPSMRAVLPTESSHSEQAPTGEQAQVSSSQISSSRRAVSSTAEDDGTVALMAPTAFVVERVATQIGPAEMATAQGTARVEDLIERVFGELQRDSGPMPPVVGQQVRLAARAELLELGPLTELLDDPSVSEIAASGTGHLMVVRGSQQRRAMPFCASGSIERAVERLCASEGVPLAPGELVARRKLTACGFDLELVRGAISPHGALLRLRRSDRVAHGLEDLVRLGTVSRAMATLFQNCVAARANILVVGAARSGATSLLSALATCVPGERALMMSHRAELADPDGRIMPLTEGHGGQLMEILSQASELPGHRLVVDDLLYGEWGLATLQTAFQGADGLIARLRARSIERGVAQLCAQLSVLRPGLSVGTVADGVIATFDLAVEVGRLHDGRSRVLRVAELSPGESMPVVAEDIFTFRVERIATGGAVEGSFTPTGRQPRFAAELKTRGVRMDSGMFGRAPRPPHSSS